MLMFYISISPRLQLFEAHKMKTSVNLSPCACVQLLTINKWIKLKWIDITKQMHVALDFTQE